MTNSDVSVFPFDIPPALDVVPEFERLRSQAPVTLVRLATGGDAYLVTRYDDVRRVYADALFSRARLVEPDQPVLLPGNKLPDVLLNTDPPEHTRLRRLVTRAFTARAISASPTDARSSSCSLKPPICPMPFTAGGGKTAMYASWIAPSRCVSAAATAGP